MNRTPVSTYRVDIYVGGNFSRAKRLCRDYCDEVGLCVSIHPIHFAYTGGGTDGVRVGFINYARFPATPEEIFAKAEALAERLIAGLGQESASIVADDRTLWLSRRPADTDPFTCQSVLVSQ